MTKIYIPNLSRRSVLKTGACGLSLAGLTLNGRIAFAEKERDEPHFFLQVMIPFGMDPSYLFDARPLKMTTEDNIIQNYLKVNPKPWQGVNGTTTWATKLTKPLEEYRNDFSVLNGVVMAANFDGHDQNTNFLLSANPFGGEFFAPIFNANSQPTPLDYVQSGFIGISNITNAGASVTLNPRSAQKLVKSLSEETGFDKASPVSRFITQRLVMAQKNRGRFAKGAEAMASGYEKSPDLVAKLKQIEIPDQDPDSEDPMVELRQELLMMTQLFKNRATKTALLGLDIDGNVDAHDPEDAKEQPKTYKGIAEKYQEIFRFLKETPFDEQRSFFDVTTVIFASEFSRTLRQGNRPIDETGTDHNPLNNSILIGGKGIRGGLVLGESDTRSKDEVMSKAHMKLDGAHLKAMGRPFDFVTEKPREDLPEIYRADDYLSFTCITNTLFKLFGVDKANYRLTERSGKVAKTLNSLLT